MPRALPSMPAVTDAHRRAAFAAMGWIGWSFEAAMADAVRSRVVECRAHALRKAQWSAQRLRRVPWPPASEQPRPERRDGKRAAAGDFDD